MRVAGSSAAVLTRFSLSLSTDHQMLCGIKNVFLLLRPARFLAIITHVREGNLSFRFRSKSRSSGSEKSNPSPFLSSLVRAHWLFPPSGRRCCFGQWPFGSLVCDSGELSRELSHCTVRAQNFGVLQVNLVFPANFLSAARCLSFLPYYGIIAGALLLPLEETCCPPSFGHFRASLGSGFCYKSETQRACGLILHVAFSDHRLFSSINLLGPEADLCLSFLCSSALSKQGCSSRHFLPVAFLFSLNHSCFPLRVTVCIL